MYFSVYKPVQSDKNLTCGTHLVLRETRRESRTNLSISMELFAKIVNCLKPSNYFRNKLFLEVSLGSQYVPGWILMNESF